MEKVADSTGDLINITCALNDSYMDVNVPFSFKRFKRRHAISNIFKTATCERIVSKATPSLAGVYIHRTYALKILHVAKAFLDFKQIDTEGFERYTMRYILKNFRKYVEFLK